MRATPDVKAVAMAMREYVAREIEPLMARLEALEQRPAPRDGIDGAPGPAGEKGADGLVGPAGAQGPEGPAGRDGRDGLPGVPGLQGEKGADGLHGKDGKDGKDGEKGADGTAGLTYEGVFIDGAQYDKGQCVTWGGSLWHCNETTSSKPGEGSKAWTLIVKRGRDGRDGKDATPAPVPIVSVGKPKP